MDHPLAPLADRFRFLDSFMKGLTNGLTDETWLTRASDGTNTIAWLVGHLAVYRRIAARGLGADVPEEPWEAGFRAKGTPADDAPSPTALLAHYHAALEPLATGLSALTAEQAAADAPYGMPDGTKSVNGQMHFLYMHENYHLGQVGLLRRLAGLPGVA